MATLKQGILGGFSGKVGTVIGYTRNGIAYIRGLMTSHTDANTPAQQEQRAKFSLVIKFLRPFLNLLRIGFKPASVNMSGFNAAMAYTLEHAVKGIFPSLEIDYEKVLICTGNLPGAMNPVAVSNVAGKVDFTWGNNSLDLGAKATDTVVLAAFCPQLGKLVSVIGIGTRQLGTQSMTLPETFSGQEVHTYIGFCNAAQTEFSNGEYLSSLVVA